MARVTKGELDAEIAAIVDEMYRTKIVEAFTKANYDIGGLRKGGPDAFETEVQKAIDLCAESLLNWQQVKKFIANV
jgi:hypothetical protein